jgi:hypothetical protein
MADLVQITVGDGEYGIAVNPGHAYMTVEVGSRTGKIRRHEGKLRFILTEEAFRSLEQALQDLRYTHRGGNTGR